METPLELWSVPWHTLLHSLAEGVSAAQARPFSGSAAAPPRHPRGGAASSWLARAQEMIAAAEQA